MGNRRNTIRNHSGTSPPHPSPPHRGPPALLSFRYQLKPEEVSADLAEITAGVEHYSVRNAAGGPRDDDMRGGGMGGLDAVAVQRLIDRALRERSGPPAPAMSTLYIRALNASLPEACDNYVKVTVVGTSGRDLKYSRASGKDRSSGRASKTELGGDTGERC